MTNCYRDNGHGLWQYAGLFQAITEQNPRSLQNLGKLLFVKKILTQINK